MEKILQIVQQHPISERAYTDRNNNQQVFASKGFILTDGIDTFYAEATGDYARSLGNYDQSVFHTVQLQIGIREYKDKDGNSRYTNDIRIVKIV